MTPAVGEPLPNCEVKVMDDDGVCEVPRGQRGELWCKSPTMMKGYWRKPKETRETIMPDGWLRTGDIVYRDEDGKYVVVDRKKVERPPCATGRIDC
jgi:4-coumarate--CoA ligase